MLLPIGDTPNPRGYRPYVTYALLALNLLVFLLFTPHMVRPAPADDPLLQRYVDAVVAEEGITAEEAQRLRDEATAYDLIVMRYGFRPGRPSLVGLLCAMFLHAGVLHLLGNLLFLWIFGDNVERRLGRGAYLAAYLALGLIATGGDALLRWGSQIPAVGASGAISGVLGAYFVWFPKNRVRVIVFLPPVVIPFLQLPSRLVLGFYLIVDNLLDLVLTQLSGSAEGIAYGAHIGGFVGGALLAWGYTRWVEVPRGLDPTRLGVEPAPHFALANRYLDHKMPVAAYQEVCEALHGQRCSQEQLAEARQLLIRVRERTGTIPWRHDGLLKG